jgi:hypothetical protein
LKVVAPPRQTPTTASSLDLTSIHRGGDVKRQIHHEFRGWNIFGGVLVDQLSDGRVESICRQSV